jgi:hypothetical protein
MNFNESTSDQGQQQMLPLMVATQESWMPTVHVEGDDSSNLLSSGSGNKPRSFHSLHDDYAKMPPIRTVRVEPLNLADESGNSGNVVTRRPSGETSPPPSP